MPAYVDVATAIGGFSAGLGLLGGAVFGRGYVRRLTASLSVTPYEQNSVVILDVSATIANVGVRTVNLGLTKPEELPGATVVVSIIRDVRGFLVPLPLNGGETRRIFENERIRSGESVTVAAPFRLASCPDDAVGWCVTLGVQLPRKTLRRDPELKVRSWSYEVFVPRERRSTISHEEVRDVGLAAGRHAATVASGDDEQAGR